MARGLYRYSRNPMYVGVLSLIAAQALYFGSPGTLLYAALLFLAFHTFVVALRGADARQELRSRLPTLSRDGPALDPQTRCCLSCSERGVASEQCFFRFYSGCAGQP